MVLEFQTPEGADWHALNMLTPVFLAYVLSFFYLAIYWNNHHHLLHAMQQVSGSGAVGKYAPALLAVAHSVCDGVDGRTLSRSASDRRLWRDSAALRRSRTGSWCTPSSRPKDRIRGSARQSAATPRAKISILIYAAAIPLAYVKPWIADAMYLAVALMLAHPRPAHRKDAGPQTRFVRLLTVGRRTTGNTPAHF